MSFIRTFLAVETSPEVQTRAAALIEQLKGAVSGPKDVKWVDTKTMHITMQFLGDVEDRDIATLCRVVAEAAAPVEPFDFLVSGLGAFPNFEKPRSLWLGIEEGAEELVALKEALDDGLDQLGYRRENRRFRPHLTLGRVRNENLDFSSFRDELGDYEAGVTGVDEVVIFSSVLERKGPEHEPMGRGELLGRPLPKKANDDEE